MSLIGRIAVYRRFAREHRAWQLLQADNAPLILAWLKQTFSSESEVAVQVARASLQDALMVWKSEFGATTDIDAAVYLRSWTDAGWMREVDQQLTMTDAALQALRFADNLAHRELGATASHLRVVRDAVRSLYLEVEGDREARRATLQAQIQDLRVQLERLEFGVEEKLTPEQLQERVEALVMLAKQLAGDFRHIEDEIRRIDVELRQDMVERAHERGGVLGDLLDEEDVLSRSPSGQAFDGFHQILCDTDLTAEFRAQLRKIAVAIGDTPDARYLRSLMPALTRESGKIVQRRNRIWEGLRAFVTQRRRQDEHTLDLKLEQLLRLAGRIKQRPEVNYRDELPVTVRSGRVRMNSPYTLSVRLPEEAIVLADIAEPTILTDLSERELLHLDGVRLREVAGGVRALLREHGSLGLQELSVLRPIRDGIEEVVAHLRIAYATRATPLAGTQVIDFTERDGRRGQAVVPSLLLSTTGFPADVTELF